MDWIKGKIGLPSIPLSVSSIPVELHLPGYQYCGPGTDYEGRRRKGQTGVNSLDNACMKHDAVYNSTEVKNDENRLKRRRADDELIAAASDFRKSSKKFSDKAAGAVTEAAMRAKKFLKIF